MLGLKIQHRRFTGHYAEIINKAKTMTTKLYRFANLTEQLKTTLRKTLLLNDMPSVFNKGLRFTF